VAADEAAVPAPATGSGLAPWSDPVAAIAELLPPGVLAARAADTEIDVDGVIDVGPDWIQETGGRSEPPVAPIRLAELHALWDGEVDLEPVAGAPGAGKDLAVVGPRWPAVEWPGRSTELEPFQPGSVDLPTPEPATVAPAVSAELVPMADEPARVAPGAAMSAEVALVSVPSADALPVDALPADAVPVDAVPVDALSADAAATGGPISSPPTMPLSLPGRPGARARAAAARRGARRRRNITILVAAVVALVATLVPIALKSSGGSVGATALAVVTPSARPSGPAPTATATQTAASDPTPAASASPTATVPPAPPGNQPGVPGIFLQSVPGGVTVTVIAPFNGGPVTSYQVTSNPGGARTLTKPGIFQVPASACAAVTVTARASGPGGVSEPSAPAQALGCVPPGQPTGILSVPDGNGHLVVNWNVPAEVGGNGVTLVYIVTVFRTGPSGVVSESYTVSGHSYTRTAPSAADPYFRVTVAAKNDAGVGPAVVAWGQ